MCTYKIFLLLNISDFNLFFMGKLQTPPPPKKVTPLFPSNHPVKVEVLSSPLQPNFQNLVEGSTPAPPPAERGGGRAYYDDLSFFWGSIFSW